MAEVSEYASSLVRLNVGGKKFWTRIDTLTQREPDSMLAAMFSGRHTLQQEKGYVFIDRNGKHFGYILDWLRTGVVPTLKHNKYTDLLLEAAYFQLAGLIDGIHGALNKKSAELTRVEIIKCIQTADCHRRWRGNLKFRGVNLSGLDLSNLDLSGLNFSFAVVKNVCFSNTLLRGTLFENADAEGASFRGADFTDAKLEGVCLRSATLRHAKFTNTNLKNAILEGADLQGVDLREANTEGVTF